MGHRRALILALLAAGLLAGSARALQPGATGSVQIRNGAVDVNEADNFTWTGTHDLTTGVLRLPNSTTAMTTCTDGDIKLDTDAGAGARLLVCVGGVPVPMDNAFGSEIDPTEMANTLSFAGSQVLDLNTNSAAIKLPITASDPASNGVFLIDSTSGEPEWYANSAVNRLADYTKNTGRSGSQTILGSATADGSDTGALNLAASGAVGGARGAYLVLNGNEQAFKGLVMLSAGDSNDAGGAGAIAFYTDDTSGVFGTPRMVIEQDGNLCVAQATAGSVIACSRTLGFGGNVAQTVGMERHTTSNTAGNTLTINAGGATSSATNKDGGTLRLAPGTNTGTGRALVAVSKQTVATASGTSDGTQLDALVVGPFKALADATTTALANATLASNTSAGVVINYSVQVVDGSNHVQNETGRVSCSVINSNGTFLQGGTNGCTKYGNQNVVTASGGGTLTVTWTMTAANPAVVSINADTTLTPSTGYPRVQYNIQNLTDQAVTIQ